MTAILFNNPFAAPPPAASATPTATPGLTVGAVTQTAGSALTDDTNLSKGDGPELSKQAETVALYQKRQSLQRPANATSDSVINAQTQDNQDNSEVKLGPDLPEVEMPDPLPTSPLLLQLREAS